jgi:hypothetical protein
MPKKELEWVEAAERANASDRVRCAQAMWGAAMQFDGSHWTNPRDGPGERSIGQLAGPWCVEGLPSTTLTVFPPHLLHLQLGKGGATDLPSCSPREFAPFSVTLARPAPSAGALVAGRWRGGSSSLPFPLLLLGLSGTGARECLVDSPNGPGSCPHSRCEPAN